MTAFESYYERLLLANPNLRQAESLTLSPASFREQLRKAFEAGGDHAVKTKAAMDWILKGMGL